MASKTECKIIVLVRLDSGEEVTVSVKAVNKPFSIQHKEELFQKVVREIVPLANDALYYTVRQNINGKKDNWKFEKLSELRDFLGTCITVQE